ncbi:uncharacterized protein LOC114862635 isoform X2 [Betta splendens]|uniref:Uncharacterized protein LOC114862635 isoform X2 n=1 Tax=Betta splendens TaxID=158456 RepID=A0A8M1HJC9_BETSP|nr:uncharacterized protein LOC114862635 isoform X2 [Betta splendens]
MSNHHILDHKEGTAVMCPQFQVLSDFLSAHLPKAPPTDEQILDFIEKRLAPFRNPSTQQKGDYGATLLNEDSQIGENADCNIPESSNAINLPASSFSNEENVQRQGHNVLTERHTATGGQILDNCSTSSKSNAVLTFKPTVTRDCATVTSDTHSTEYPQIMRNVAAACTKTEDAIPVVLTAVAEMSPDCSSDKSVSKSLVTCSSAKKYSSSWLTLNKSLDNTDKMPGFSWTQKSTNNQEKEETGPETSEDVQLDSLKCVTNTPVGQTHSISVVFEHNTLKPKTLNGEDANGEVGQSTEQPQHFEIVCEDVTTLSKINMGRNAHFVEFPDQKAPSVTGLKYEDITNDQGVSHQVTNQPCVQVPVYEDISEDEEPQIKNIAVETRSPIPTNHEIFNLENDGPEKGDDEGDEDEWLVIPVSVEDIDFEPENPDEEQEDVELIVLHPEKASGAGRWNATRLAQYQPDSDPALAVVPSQIEVFDTFDSFVKAKSKQLGFCKSTPPDELHPNTTLYNAQDNKMIESESEDSCETDDSCDYSSATERNRLTVDRRLLKEISEPAPSDHFLSEHKGRTRRHKCKEVLDSRKGSGPKASEANDVIVLNSDTDDESDQMKKTALFLSSEDGAAPCHESSLPFESNFIVKQLKQGTNRINVSAQQDIINIDSDSDSSGSGNGQLTEDREHNKQGTSRPRMAKVVKKDSICKKKPSVERTVSLVSGGGGSTSFSVQNKLSTKMANHHTDSERPKKKTSKSSSDRLPQSVSKKARPDEPVIGRLFVVGSSPPGSHLKLSKEPKNRLGEEERKSHTKTKSASGPDNNRTANKPLASVTKPKLASRQMSNQERLSLSISTSTTTSEQFPQVRQRSASVTVSALSSVPKSKPSTSVATHHLSSSKLKRSHSYSSASTLELPKTLSKDLVSSTNTQSFAKKRLRTEWHDSFVPTKLDRRPSPGADKPLRNKSCDSSGHARPGPSHQSRPTASRHQHVNKFATPLMKRTKQEAIQRTKDINRTMSSGPSNIVSKHYKWAEEQKPVKASGWKRKSL